MSQPHNDNPYASPSQGTSGHQPVIGQSPWAQPEQPWQWGPPAYSTQPTYPPYPGHPAPAPQPPQQPPPKYRDRNSFATAAMVLGILGFFLPNPILSVVFGILALSQIGKRGERGKGMAISGIVLGVLWIAGYVALVAAAILDDVERDPSGEVRTAGRVALENLQVGDCVKDTGDAEHYSSVEVVPCDQPHQHQVFAKFDVRGEEWPGNDEIRADAGAGCSDALLEYAPTAYDDPDVMMIRFYPSRLTWADGDREIICLTDYLDGPRTGSIEGK